MLFNSLGFTIFLPIVFVLYWFLAKKSVKHQNLLLLVSSYFFYGCWDWRFLGLLAFSTFLDFYSGQRIYRAESNAYRKMWLIISVCLNLGFLAFFKYFNFFISSFSDLLQAVGLNSSIQTLNTILPIGISFYTFHGLSYVFDIYNRKIKPSSNLLEYSLFVSFFPLLVAGPIERATHLLPQIKMPRLFRSEQAVDGLRQMLWGFFKKIVVADGCAKYANMTFNDPGSYPGSTLFLGAIFFAFQIYGDFSGYSDIAQGTARLFGFKLLKNFSFPYFSRDIAEFWRRWHISLSSWFKDYLYFPLGGSRGGKLTSIRNTLIIFIVSGFWHGANWTYIIWGIYHALLFIPLLIINKNRKNTNVAGEGKLLPSFYEFVQIVTTFCLVVIGWIFFRSANIKIAVQYFKGIFNLSLFSAPDIEGIPRLALSIFIMLLVEWLQRTKNHGLEIHSNNLLVLRWVMYMTIFIICIANFRQNQEFIYFQF